MVKAGRPGARQFIEGEGAAERGGDSNSVACLVGEAARRPHLLVAGGEDASAGRGRRRRGSASSGTEERFDDERLPSASAGASGSTAGLPVEYLRSQLHDPSSRRSRGRSSGPPPASGVQARPGSFHVACERDRPRRQSISRIGVRIARTFGVCPVGVGTRSGATRAPLAEQLRAQRQERCRAGMEASKACGIERGSVRRTTLQRARGLDHGLWTAALRRPPRLRAIAAPRRAGGSCPCLRRPRR